MSVQANVPVLYLDSYQVDIKCEHQIVNIKTFNRPLQLPKENRVLIVLGKYSELCQKLEYGIIFSKAWSIDRDFIAFQISDPEVEGIYGEFSINLNSIQRVKAQRPKDPALFLPFPFDFDISQRIRLSKHDIVIDCNPCRIHGIATIDVSVHGELFKPFPIVVAKIEIEQESVFNVTSHMEKGLNIQEEKHLISVPLAPLNVPNIIAVNPVFGLDLKAYGNSQNKMVITTGESSKSGTLSTTFYHEGLNNNVKITSDGSRPFYDNSMPRAVLYLADPELKFYGDTRLRLEFNPFVQMSISVLGKHKPEEVKAGVSHVFQAISTTDLSCPSGSHIKVTTEATFSGKIGNIKSPIIRIAQKSLLDKCIEINTLH